MVEEFGSDFLQGKRFLLFSKCSDGPWGPPSLLCNDIRGFFSEIKRPEREADHSSSFNAEVKNGAAIPPLYKTSS
jgi:hypothetical protein